MCNCNKNFYVFYLCVYVTFCIFDKNFRVDVTKKILIFSLCNDYFFLSMKKC